MAFLKVKIFEKEKPHNEIMLNLDRVDWFYHNKGNDATSYYANTVQVFIGGDYFQLDRESSKQFLTIFNGTHKEDDYYGGGYYR